MRNSLWVNRSFSLRRFPVFWFLVVFEKGGTGAEAGVSDVTTPVICFKIFDGFPVVIARVGGDFAVLDGLPRPFELPSNSVP